MNEIFTRRSVRKFLPQPVEEEKIEKMLRAGMAAPSAGNQQPWEFYVVRDKKNIAGFIPLQSLCRMCCQGTGRNCRLQPR